MSRVASLKEFAFMTALHKRGFPTPTPYDANRHGIVMSLVKAYPMVNVKGLINPEQVYHRLIELIIQFAEHGLVHGDFNEFNLMISDTEDITVIDFPQMTSTNHLNAAFYFDRDVKCIQRFFTKRFGLEFEGGPILETDVRTKVDLATEIKASGFATSQEMQDYEKLNENYLDKKPEVDQEQEEKKEESEDEEDQDMPEEEVEQDDGTEKKRVTFDIDIDEGRKQIQDEVGSESSEEE